MNIPELTGDLEAKIDSLVGWLNRSIEKKPWTDEDIEKKFGFRSAIQIMEEGNVCYMNSCVDYTLVAYEILRKNGVNATIILDEFLLEGEKPSRVHFAIEIKEENQTYILDFISLNRVMFRKGGYRNADSFETLQTIRLENLDPEKNLVENFPGIVERVKSYDIKPHLERLKRDNTPETYEKYLEALGEHRELYVVRD